MPCNRCGMEIKRTDIVCVACGARILRPAKVPGAVCTSGRYTHRRPARQSPLQIRAKRGFSLLAGVLPTPPVQTASAAAPAMHPLPASETAAPRNRQAGSKRIVTEHPRPAPATTRPPAVAHPLPQSTAAPHNRVPPRIEPGISSRPEPRPPSEPGTDVRPAARAEPRPGARIEPRLEPHLEPLKQRAPKPQLTPRQQSANPACATPVRPVPSVQAPPSRTPARRALPSERQPARAHRVPGPRRPPPSHTALVSGIVVAGLALVMGSVWWGDVHSDASVPGMSAAAPQRAESTDQQLALNAPPEPSAGTSHTETTPASAPAAESTSEATPTDKPVAAAPVKRSESLSRQARKRSTPLVKQDRSEEIERLRTQAFSETRKDRISRINGARGVSKLPVSSSRVSAAYAGTRRALTQCGYATNILRREQCKWKVCGGRWGQQGCPSFEDKQVTLF